MPHGDTSPDTAELNLKIHYKTEVFLKLEKNNESSLGYPFRLP